MSTALAATFALASAGTGLAGVEQGAEGDTFEPPVRVASAAGPVSVKDPVEGLRQGYGYAGVHVGDIDGDGIADLLVGEIMGGLRLYRGTGDSDGPRFAAPTAIAMTDGELLKFKNW